MRNKTFRVSMVIMVLFSLIVVTGCSDTNKANDYGYTYEGELILTGLEKDIKIPYNDIFAMEPITRDVDSVTSSGENIQNTIKGVLLDTLLQKNGLSQKDYGSIRFIGDDGYAIDVPAEIVKNKEIILAYEFDGEKLDEKKQPLRVAIDDERSMYYVSQLKEINFNLVNEDKTSDNLKVIILETAENSLDKEELTYYESVDKAIKVANLFNNYVSEKTDKVALVAADGFEKTEEYDVLSNGYIKITGENHPLFIDPNLPKGMQVKYIYKIIGKNSIFISAEKANEILPSREINGQNGVAVDALIEDLGLKGDSFVITAVDGYKSEVAKEDLQHGIMYLSDKNQYNLIFDESISKSSSVKDVLSIEAKMLDKIDRSQTQQQNNQQDTLRWVINIDGLSDGSFQLSNEKAARKLKLTSVHTKRIKNGEEKLEDWQGYKVADVLEFLRVEDYKSILITAQDGYEMEYTKDKIDDETILAIIKNRQTLKEETNLVQFVQNTETSQGWVKGVSKITVKH